jgi:hypothetical protein
MCRLSSFYAAAVLVSTLAVCPVKVQEESQRPSTSTGAWPKTNRLTVDLASLKAPTRSLPPHERTEQIRDWAFAAAFSISGSDRAYRELFLAQNALVRRTYLSPFLDQPIGEGRVAALDRVTYLLLVPRSSSLKDSNLGDAIACRLLDERVALDGRVPEKVEVVLYEIESDGDQVRLERLAPRDGREFYTNGRHGYVEKAIASKDDLRAFLAATDDLLGVRTTKESLIACGRKHDESRYKRPFRRFDLEDVRTIWKAYRDRKWTPAAASEVGFSLDPWIESRPVSEGLTSLLARHEGAEKESATLREQIAQAAKKAESAKPESKGFRAARAERSKLEAALDQASVLLIDSAYRERIQKLIETLKTHDIFRIPETRFSPGADLFLLPSALEVAAGAAKERGASREARPLEQLGEDLRELVDRHQVSVARYDGGLAGTEVGMTLFYCDILGKLWSWGQVNGNPITGMPDVPGFQSHRNVRPAAMYWPEILATHQRRFWWGLDPKGVVVVQQDSNLSCRFGPVSCRLFIKGRGEQFEEEQEPNILVATALDSWNRRFLAIADGEPEFHRLNQFMKWAVAFKVCSVEEETMRRFGFLDAADGKVASGKNLWFADWYESNLKSARLGVRLPVVVRRFQSSGTEAVERFNSGPMEAAGEVRTWVGGVSGPSAKEIERRIAKPSEERPTGLPGSADFEGTKVKEDEIRFKRLDGRETASVPGNLERVRASSIEGRPPRTVLSEISSKSAAVEVTVRSGPGSEESGAILRDPQTEVAIGRLNIERAGENVLKVTWNPDVFDRAQSLAQAITAKQEPEAGSYTELRYTKDGKRVLFRLAHAPDFWLELAAGGSGGNDGGGGIRTFSIGSPDGPGWNRGRIRAHADVVADLETAQAPGPRYRILSEEAALFGLGRRVLSKGEYLLGGKAELTCRFVGGGAIHLRDDGKIVVEGSVAEKMERISPDGLELLDSLLNESRSRRVLRYEDNQYKSDVIPGLQQFVAALPFLDGLKVLAKNGEAMEFKENSILGKVDPDTTVRLAFSKADAGELIRVVRLEGEQVAVQYPLTLSAEKMADVTAVIGALNRDKELVGPLARFDSLTARAVADIVARRSSLRQRVPSNARFVGNQLQLRLSDGTRLSVNEAIAALDDNKPLPAVWSQIAGRDLFVDVGGDNPDATLPRQLGALAELDRRMPNVRLYYRSGVAGENQRLAGLLNWSRVTIANDSTAMERVTADWVGRISKEYITSASRSIKNLVGSIRLHVDHFDNEGVALETLRRQARAGDFEGQHLVLGICNPTKDTATDFYNFSRLAIEKGALSVTFPDGTRDLRALLLVIDRVQRDPAIQRGLTPQDLLPSAYDAVRQDLQECLKADSTELAVRQKFAAFGADRAVELFFDRPKQDGGKFDKSIIEATIKRMGRDADARGWIPVVIRVQGNDLRS